MHCVSAFPPTSRLRSDRVDACGGRDTDGLFLGSDRLWAEDACLEHRDDLPDGGLGVEGEGRGRGLGVEGEGEDEG